MKWLKTVCSLGGIIRQRFFLVFMLLMAIVNTYTMRVSLNLALVKMCSPPKQIHKIGGVGSIAAKKFDFDWPRSIQGWIKSSFYVGYIITHVPGGMLSDRYGAKWVLFGGLACTIICTALIPVTSFVGGWQALIALRILTGFGEGVVFPAIAYLLAKWIPLQERGRLGAITLTGAQVGIIVTYATAGITLDAWHWKWTFYIYAGVGVIFLFFWAILVFSLPSQHPYISDRELEFLSTSISFKEKPDPVPWKKILTSYSAWGMVIGQFGHDWGLFTAVHELPPYLDNVLHYNIKSNGFLNSLTYLVMWLVANLLGILADYLISRKKLSVLSVRNLWTFIGEKFDITISTKGCDGCATNTGSNLVR